uniref:Uncharacterized protein n=1 Tax=Aegilops tauschii subsp. strangulata TaxID=200361 RepID=A0A453EYS1_AEGTS
MVDEASYLREANDRLTRQIEQLHSDHCAHVEELVYLKWVNACLRHDLRGGDHHPSSAEQDQDGAGSAMPSAMDLSKSMSYRSSEKAKELMLQYGSLGLDGYDPALFSPLNESTYGDGESAVAGRGRARESGRAWQAQVSEEYQEAAGEQQKEPRPRPQEQEGRAGPRASGEGDAVAVLRQPRRARRRQLVREHAAVVVRPDAAEQRDDRGLARPCARRGGAPRVEAGGGD